MTLIANECRPIPRTGVLVLTALLLGCGDACLNTQIISLLGGAYKVDTPREVFLKKKLLPFGHCPKVALTPPLILDTCGVTLIKTNLGKTYN